MSWWDRFMRNLVGRLVAAGVEAWEAGNEGAPRSSAARVPLGACVIMTHMS